MKATPMGAAVLHRPAPRSSDLIIHFTLYIRMAGVEIYQAADGPLAHGAESFALVGAHAAVLIGAIYAFGHIPCTFVHSDALGQRRLRRSGHSGAFGKHILPFFLKVAKGGKVLLPRLDMREIEVAIGTVVGIFVAQPGKAVAELMHHHGTELGVVRGGEGIGVVDAAATVSVGVGQDDDVLIGNAGQQVVEVAHTERGEVTVGIERGEVRAERRLPPNAFLRDAHVGLFRDRTHGHEVETVAQLGEWLMRQDGIDRLLSFPVEVVHLGSREAFGHDGHVYFLLRAATLQQVTVGCGSGAVQTADEDVVGADGMRETGLQLLVHAVEVDRYAGGVVGHGQQEGVLERAAELPCLISSNPFLEKGGERLLVKHFSAAGIAQGDVAVAPDGHTVHVDGATRPSGEAAQLAQADVLLPGIAGELVVNAERAVPLHHALGRKGKAQ